MNADLGKEYLVKRISSNERYDDILQFPRYFEIETVNACNARCPMCTIADWQRDSPVMKDELFAKIAGELSRHAGQIKRVSLFRDGEPLLDKKLAKRIAILKEGGIRQVGISTNVSLLDERRSRELLEAGLDEIVLSIDSLNKGIFEKIRVRLDFDEVMENALRFIELRNRIRPSTSIWMRMIRQEANKDEWPEYREFWAPKMTEIDRLYYLNVHNWGDQLAGYQPVSKSYQPELPCVALWSLMVIFANGDVPLCNVDYNNKYPLGNIGSSSIAELWRSKVANERRDLHLAGQKSHFSLCGNCTVWNDPVDRENHSKVYA
ncbi:molybdenum cofactor biosynthesis protein MoaB [Skermanella stibiiresistens SB22]|uniref:Molybdenum cofactor biosynthesis protein MoaB n=1 Tax=Skermanella stibiiresistens SB22 TaxID=1385369 RepID=W9HCP2_9PROT|nr:radical SAM/SPASM domain-containing protein [Skermanella stibiiresistens]EWY42506.1 molybdenum cofactor biosynthesis protein MoaB [Skermanella stibiiresistens SB22]